MRDLLSETTTFVPPKLPVPAIFYGLDSVAALLFLGSAVLFGIGMMGFAQAAVEQRKASPVAVVVLTVAVTGAGLAIVCYIASPAHNFHF